MLVLVYMLAIACTQDAAPSINSPVQLYKYYNFLQKCLTVVPFIASLTACFNLFDILRLPDPTEFENSDSDNIKLTITLQSVG